MKRYEEILSKVSYVFYKVINYRKYFDIYTGYEFSYLHNAGISYDTIYSPCDIPITKAPTYFLSINRAGVIFSPTVTLYEDYRRGRYVVVTHEDAIVDLVLNKFSFEKHKVIRPQVYKRSIYDYSPDTFKDLFIAAVGKDTYETIKNNIK
jgi:hypothetical protein